MEETRSLAQPNFEEELGIVRASPSKKTKKKAKAPRQAELAPEFDELGIKLAPAKQGKAGRVARQSAGGLVSGALGSLGNLGSVVADPERDLLPGEKAAYGAEFEALQDPDIPDWVAGLMSDDDLAPRYSKLPTTGDVAQLLGLSEPEGRLESDVRRASENVGGLLPYGSGLLGLLGAAGGGVAGSEVGRATGSPLLGTIADVLLSILIPTSAAKRAASKVGKAGRRAKTAERFGVTAEELAPMERGALKEGVLKVAGKGKSAKGALEKARSGTDKIWRGLEKEAQSYAPLRKETLGVLKKEVGGLESQLAKGALRGPEKEAVLKHLKGFQKNLIEGAVTPETLMADWAEINNLVDWNKVKGGKKALAGAKKFIANALKTDAPELFDLFEDSNKLYTSFKNLEKSVGGKQAYGRALDKMKNLGVAYQLVTLNLPGLAGSLGIDLGRRALTKYLLSPRGSGLLQKALTYSSIAAPQKLGRINAQIEKDLRKIAEEDQNQSQKRSEQPPSRGGLGSSA